MDQPHSIGERYRELERMRALELAIDQTETKRLFLAVEPADIEAPHQMFSHLRQLQGQLPSGWELGITISLSTDVDILRFTDVYHEAQEHDLRVAFDEFQGNGAQVVHLKSLLPDYLILGASMTKDLNIGRQPLRRLESLLEACNELAVKSVLPTGESGTALALCQEIGFDLVLSSSKCPAAPRLQKSSTSVHAEQKLHDVT
jgi:EAL domain-containing protein (putative c-di-GMP-specific phosphodiesterase class I)